MFAENKNDVDDIHEYFLLKGVETVAIHGGKSKETFCNCTLFIVNSTILIYSSRGT